MTAVSIPDQLAAAKREVGFRRRVYARMVEAGKMTAAQADREIAAMEAICETLERLDEKERLL